MRGRVIGSYVAVVPDEQGESKTSSGIILKGAGSKDRFISGKVISLGSRCPDGISVGDRVLYEVMSAHPSQSGPIDADMFGGESGKFCVIIPVYKKSLKSVSELEEELHRHREDVMDIEKRHSLGQMTKLDHERLQFHERRLDELTKARQGRGRGSDLGKTYDLAKGAGVVAIIEGETNG